MRYLARISYDGSNFLGFQRLNKGRSVQKELEKVLSVLNKRNVEVKGAGRTDAFVHALDQCVHFDLDYNFDEEKLKFILNGLLPKDLSVNSILKVKDDFHARFDVVEKTYLYKIYGGEKNPFYSNYAFCYSQKLNLDLMKKAAGLFLGCHDFQNFVSGVRDDYHSVINDFQIWQENDFWYFQVSGQSFYRYMVRHLVGAIVDVGRGKASIEEIKESLAKPQNKKEFLVVPAQGLYLIKIKY